jgi:hypothetical protein
VAPAGAVTLRGKRVLTLNFVESVRAVRFRGIRTLNFVELVPEVRFRGERI